MKIDFDRYTHTGREAAAALKIDPATLCRWAQTRPGFPQPLRLSRKIIRYDLNAIKCFLVGEA